MALPAKLAALCLGLIAIAIALVSLALLDRNLKLIAGGLIASADHVSRDVAVQTRTLIAAPQGRPETAPRSALTAALRSTIETETNIAFVHVIGPDGAVVADLDASAAHGASPRSVTDLENLVRSPLPIGLFDALWSDATYQATRPLTPGPAPSVLVEVAVTTRPVEAQVHSLVWTLGALALGALLIAAAAGSMLVMHPYARAMEPTGNGGKGSTVKPAGDDLDALAVRFNQLSERLKSDRSRWDNERGNFTGSFRSMTDAVLLVDADGSLLFANNEARERLELAGNSFDEGKSLRLLLGQDHPLIQLIEPALLAGTEARGVAFRLDERHGGRTFLVSIFSLGAAGRTAGLLVLMRDLERVRELESMIEQSGHLARLGSLLSGVAHQIRKPLNVMMLQLELLRQDADNGKVLSGRVERIRHEIRRLDVTIDALMRFMRPEQLKLQELDLNQLLRQLGRQVNSPDIRIEYQLDPALPHIVADRALLSEGLANIINNAIEAMDGSGVLSLRSVDSGNGFVAVAITDHGPGISTENLEKIFNLYFTTKERGSGLGLSLAARAIDMQGGSIDVNSELGAGTTFTVSLPVRRGPDAAPPPADEVVM